MSHTHSSGTRPRLACEIGADRVLAGRAAEPGGSVEFAAFNLRPGTVVPDLTETNLRNADTVSQTIRDTLNNLGSRTRDVIAVLPDASVRVVLLDFEALPSNRHEAEAVVRFRLKKSLPFDVEKAKVSYHSQPATSGVRVVAAVALNSVVEEYETAFVEAGYSPGVVLPSMLAALGTAKADRPTLVLKVDTRTISIAILDRQQVLLFRTLENTSGVAITGERLAEEVYPSVVFFQDTYHMNIDGIYVAGLPDLPAAAPALRAQTGAEVQELVSAYQLGSGRGAIPQWQIAGVVGALAS
jgi:type IV pilus assembly protein PilM